MHRTSPKSRSLSVQRETLRVLASSELTSVEGGTGYARLRTFLQVGCNDAVLDIIERGSGSAGAPGACTVSPSTGDLVINPVIRQP